MRKATIIIALMIFLTLTFMVTPVQAGIVRPKPEFIQIMKDLCDSRPEVASYESVGKSIDGLDIWCFKIGNPDGGRWLWDSTMHGGEDTGAECIRIFTDWLLNSGDSRAEQYLLTNYILAIPHLNPDRTSRQNHRRHYTAEETVGTQYEGAPLDIPYGVNLNRNFPTGFGKSGTANFSSTHNYRGIKGASEPETRALMNAFEMYQPDIYLNCHNWAGPKTHYWHSIDPTIIDKMKALQQAQIDSGLCPAPTVGDGKLGIPLVKGGAGGYAIAEGNNYGVPSFLIEFDPKDGFAWEERTSGYRQPSLDAIVSYYYPRCFPHFLAFLDYCAIEYVPPEPEPPTQPPTEPPPEQPPGGPYVPPPTEPFGGPGDILPSIDLGPADQAVGAVFMIAVVFVVLYWKDIKKCV